MLIMALVDREIETCHCDQKIRHDVARLARALHLRMGDMRGGG